MGAGRRRRWGWGWGGLVRDGVGVAGVGGGGEARPPVFRLAAAAGPPCSEGCRGWRGGGEFFGVRRAVAGGAEEIKRWSAARGGRIKGATVPVS